MPLTINSPDVQRGCRAVIESCALVQPGEVVVVVTDHDTAEIGAAMMRILFDITENAELHTISNADIHGTEPDESIAGRMLHADVILGLPRMSMAHTHARKLATEAGARYLSLADYSLEVLARDAMTTDFQSLTPLAEYVGEILSAADSLHLTSPAGTNMTCRVGGRQANVTPGWCAAPGTMASPPDAETNIAIIEDSSAGKLVIDGSIPCNEFGIINIPLTLFVEGGRVAEIEGDRADVLREVFDRQGTDKTRVLAEFGIGLNPKASLTGFMLEDEGCLGTVHIGIGSNATIGGINKVPFHLDFIMRSPDIHADGKAVMQNGVILGADSLN